MTHQIDLSSICRSVTFILWCSNFASYLDYLLKKKKKKNMIGMIDQSHSEIDFVNYMWVSDLYFMLR